MLDYWLSLWEGDELPWRRRFEPVRVRDLLPGVLIMEVKPLERVIVRLSGAAINAAFGFDLTGRDLLALTPESQRETRLARNSEIAAGDIVALVRRNGSYADGAAWESEELQLPFRDITADGGRLILLHTTLRPMSRVIDPARGIDVADEWNVISLARR